MHKPKAEGLPLAAAPENLMGQLPESDILAAGRDADDGRLQHMFDPWLSCKNRLVETVCDNLNCFWDQLEPPRQRKLREADRRNREAIIRAVAANIAFAVMMGFEPAGIGISLRAGKQKKSRYDRDGFTGVPRVVGMLDRGSGAGLLKLNKSARRGFASSIEPSDDFRASLERVRFMADDFQQLPGREAIWLSRTERDFAGNVEGRELIDYVDTEETKRHRADVERINAALEAADIGFEPDGDRPVPTRLRSLRRVFNLPHDEPEEAERFDMGGRLFGGWWQDLPSIRRAAIRIEGEPIADLDFASMFLRLAYIQVGEVPPSGDLYSGIPGLQEPRWRPGVKKVVSSMLFRRSPLTRAPRGTRGMLPSGLAASDLRAAIIAAHPRVAGVFETGVGLRLMFQESQVLVAALLAMAEARVVALPMHDGLMVAQSKASTAARIMGDAAEAVTGHRLSISLKSQY